MAGEEGVQKAATCEEESSAGVSSTTQLNPPVDGDQWTTEVPEPQPQAEDAGEYPEGYDDDYQDDDAEYDYDDEAAADDDYDYESDYDYDSDYDYKPLFEEERPKVREALLSFPEAANLEPHELDAAVERVLEQSKPEYADVAAPGKIRLLSEDVKIALDPWMPPPPGIFNDWFPRTRDEDLSMYSPDVIAKKKELARRRKELDREYLLLCEKPDEERERFRAKVRKELIEKGFVEVDEDYYDKKDEHERQMMLKLREEWDRMTMEFSRFRVANSEDGI